ncbi:hypothetical protein BDR03DRAFT_749022 [Suillus americanus]|nr:hypothetical protein BDR03DRAFT_749022 [Suillus americanus]
MHITLISSLILILIRTRRHSLDYVSISISIIITLRVSHVLDHSFRFPIELGPVHLNYHDILLADIFADSTAYCLISLAICTFVPSLGEFVDLLALRSGGIILMTLPHTT